MPGRRKRTLTDPNAGFSAFNATLGLQCPAQTFWCCQVGFAATETSIEQLLSREETQHVTEFLERAAVKGVMLAVSLDAKGQVDGLVAHHAVAANLDSQGIEENDRVHGFQRAALPSDGLGHDFVRFGADEVRRDLGAVTLGQKALDLAHTHAAGVYRNDTFIKGLFIIKGGQRHSLDLFLRRNTFNGGNVDVPNRFYPRDSGFSYSAG